MAIYREHRREEANACVRTLWFLNMVGVAVLVGMTVWSFLIEPRKGNASCDHLRHKLVDNWEDVFRCKLTLADYCDGVMKQELHAQHKQQEYYMERLNILAQTEYPNTNEVKLLVRNVTKFIDYHQTTLVDICGYNLKCIKCLRDCVNLWSKRNYTCNSDNAWRVVQYSPKGK